MIFEEYENTIKAFHHEASLSLTETFDAVCEAQDRLIAGMVEQGATVAGWKIVDKDGVIILSPIFDFQLFGNAGETVPSSAIRGTELEVCFQLFVPSDQEEVNKRVDEWLPFAAVELIRPAIHLTNHSACDFYFNYGVFVSQKPVAGALIFEGGKQGYRFSAELDALMAVKKDIVKQGVLQCIDRGYANKDYFFITGTLNGLVPAIESLGENRVINQGETVIQFDLA
ncbi:hypothetical protein HGG82_04590 [Marinomonas sp. M1K-6]|uniref:Uncharacterized protein n=1 Tax=Marinomonas profundi TaxID=2726122 RepID=A0A847QVF6_9GAMM|nr:hypothetical protein [Marinomonas profundi]NLQ16898.1 hypothetical protein [Marinomonas profundi]UDV02630.1 hypothetical protein J8N69_13680 [Marinomonas profundi]